MNSDKRPLVDAQAARLFAHDEAVEKAKDLALRLLTARPRSRSEVIRRLRGRGFSRQAIEGAVAALERLGLLDDRAFARGWVERRQVARPTGRQGLERELSDRGVAPDVIAEVLDEMLTGRDAEEEALALLRARSGKYRGLDREKALGRMYGLLSRRGFEADIARAAALRLWQEMEDPSPLSRHPTCRSREVATHRLPEGRGGATLSTRQGARQGGGTRPHGSVWQGGHGPTERWGGKETKSNLPEHDL